MELDGKISWKEKSQNIGVTYNFSILSLGCIVVELFEIWIG
jgi:hypothetical protein